MCALRLDGASYGVEQTRTSPSWQRNTRSGESDEMSTYSRRSNLSPFPWPSGRSIGSAR